MPTHNGVANHPRPTKPEAREATNRAGITHQILGEALGKDHTQIYGAMQERPPPEQSGELACALGELTPPTTKEGREIFREVVNRPGKRSVRSHTRSQPKTPRPR